MLVKNSKNKCITQKELKSQLNYNKDTGIFTWMVSNNNKIKIGSIAGSLHKQSGYIRIAVLGIQYQAHRLAFLYETGHMPEKVIDHINGVRADNRIVNLRDVSPTENNQNQKVCQVSNHSSKLLGVTFNENANKWQAQISRNGRNFYIGLFVDKSVAHENYLQKKREIHSGCTI